MNRTTKTTPHASMIGDAPHQCPEGCFYSMPLRAARALVELCRDEGDDRMGLTWDEQVQAVLDASDMDLALITRWIEVALFWANDDENPDLNDIMTIGNSAPSK